MGRFTERQNLGMGGRVVKTDRPIMAASHDLIVNHYDGADRNLPGLPGLPSFVQREAHEKFI